MVRGLLSRLLAAATLVACLAPALARAEPPPATPEVEQAREAFRRGAELAKDAQWGAALAAFERSYRLRQHAWTTYNVGVCERALGHYVRAKRAFARALEERTPDADLPESTVLDTRRFLAEIELIVASLDVKLDPADAAITVDGAPLERLPASEGAPPTLVAGTLGAGKGAPPPAGAFRLVLDPGTHVILIQREGFASAVHTEVVKPGDRRGLELVVDRIPATIAITSNQADAVVSVDDLDVGVAPVEIARPAGVHHVVVRKPGFDPFSIDARVTAGQRLDVAATLKQHKPSLVTRWWFWTGAAAVVAGAVVTTYAVTRPAPQRPPVDGGALGWSVKVP
jgi:hypothetical protein